MSAVPGMRKQYLLTNAVDSIKTLFQCPRVGFSRFILLFRKIEEKKR